MFRGSAEVRLNISSETLLLVIWALGEEMGEFS